MPFGIRKILRPKHTAMKCLGAPIFAVAARAIFREQSLRVYLFFGIGGLLFGQCAG